MSQTSLIRYFGGLTHNKFRWAGEQVNIESSKKYGSWSGAEIEAFLEKAHIPLRVSLMTKNGMLIVPVWYEYRAGRLLSCSPESSLLVRSLRENPDIAFDLSTNELPYRGVRGRGTSHCTTAPDNAALERLLQRYLTSTDSALAEQLLGRSEAEAIIEFEIEWLTSWDFRSRMDRIEKISDRVPGAVL